MIEVIDNAVQLLAISVCAVIAAVRAYRRQSQSYSLIACFFITFSLGMTYWLIYLLLKTYTPKVFYVSDLSWIGSFLFLLTFVIYYASPEERRFRHPAAWISPVIGIIMMLFYYRWGDYLTNTLWCGLTAAVGWFSIRGLIFARRQPPPARNRQYLHIVILSIIFLEYGLWTTSCFWSGNTFRNPYFYFDFALTATAVLLLPAMRKAEKK